jgi:starch phosphorylase
MVQEYIEKCYWPSAQRYGALAVDNLKKATELAQWRKRLGQGWPQIRVESVEAASGDAMHVGKDLEVKAKVNLGAFSPEEVEVQLFHGLVDSFGEIPTPRTVTMSHNGVHEGSNWIFAGKIPCQASGQHGFAVRVLPRHQNLSNPFEPGLVCWG